MKTFLGLTGFSVAFATMWVAMFLMSGCKLVPDPVQQLSAETMYKRDMVITVNGVTEEGVLVVPLQKVNSFRVVSRGNLDLFTLVSCAREWSKERAWNVSTEVRSGLFGWGTRKIEKTNEVTFEYVADQELESSGDCPVILSGLDAKGKHSWGFVDFKTPQDTMKGSMTCNGVHSKFDGATACQSRNGLYQVIKFDEAVMVSPGAGCEIGDGAGGRFEFQMPKGICTYRFEAVADAKRRARVTLIGYDSILIRGEE